MHDIQRKAIFAMLTAIEQQLAGVRSLLSMEEAAGPTQTKPAQGTTQQAYFADKEEDELDAIMEKERLAMVAEGSRMAAVWNGKDEVTS
jgi:hypothetical protein